MLINSQTENLPDTINGAKINSQEIVEIASDNIDDESEPLQDIDYEASSSEVLEALEAAFINDKNLYTILCHHALKKLYGLTGKKTLSHMNKEDIVSDAVQRIVEGKRKWKSRRVPNIVHLIFMSILSFIRNELKKLNRGDLPLYDIREEVSDELKYKSEKHKSAVTISPEEYDRDGKLMPNLNYDVHLALSYQENAGEPDPDYEELISVMEKKLENDEIAFFVFQERLDGNKSNIVIAKNLGVSVKEVEKALKRIKRILVS